MPKSGLVLKSLLAALAGASLLGLAGCSTPCDVRLCAPIDSNTSGQPVRAQAIAPAPAPLDAPADVAPMRTVPIDGPEAAAPQRLAAPAASNGNNNGNNNGASAAERRTSIGLMLPLRSAALAAPAEALRAGFMAAAARDGAGIDITLIETGDNPQETLEAYQGALVRNDIIVGPLARSAVSALAASNLVKKPTIALNHPDVRGREVPANLLVVGLSIEDEARQVAEWAAAEQPSGVALIITGASAWQKRIANSFAARWKQLGHASQLLVLADSNGYLSEAALAQLRNQVDAAAPVLLFGALDPSQAAQVRNAAGSELPFYGTSSVNPGMDPTNQIPELVGVRLLDLPWEVQPAHPAAMVYPRWLATNGSSGGSGGSATPALDMDRLYALGIDSFRVAREISLRSAGRFTIDGVTGSLTIDFGQGPARFERVQRAAVYQGGGFSLIGPGAQ